LLFVSIGVNGQRLRFAQKENGFARQIIKQRGQGRIRVGVEGLGQLLENSQFARRRQDDGADFSTRNLRERVELAQRF